MINLDIINYIKLIPLFSTFFCSFVFIYLVYIDEATKIPLCIFIISQLVIITGYALK